MWSRVFGAESAEVSPASILEHLHQHNLMVEGRFRGDDLGWTACELALPIEPGSPITIERYLTKEDDLRADLNSWAAGLEAAADYSPNAPSLMERVIQTQQLFTVHRPIDHRDEVTLERLIQTVCQYLATRTMGFYQIDQQGFYDRDGTLLVEEY